MTPHPNYTAYNGVEDVSRFSDLKEMERYCEVQLRKSEPQAEFIKVLTKGKKVRVGEFCSGSSRLLYALSQKKILESGVGVEISQSRHEFAESWRRRIGLDNVKNYLGDCITADIISPVVDLAVCITGAFQYFEPIHDTAPGIVLRNIRKCTADKGKLVLELYNHPKELSICKANNGVCRQWQELPIGDPWRYYLSKLTYDEDRNWLGHGKVFIGRDGSIDDKRMEVLRLYRPTEISDVLDAYGWKMIGFFGSWGGDKATEKDDITIVVAEAV